jgi:hypothetical protein
VEKQHSTEIPMDHYPVDDISKKTSCEMHVPMKNISMKVVLLGDGARKDGGDVGAVSPCAW